MPLPEHTRILEGIVTSRDADRAVNVAPMGPIVDDAMTRLILRPFTTSTTYRNLKATRQGVFHVTDDALMIARGAIGRLRAAPDAGLSRSDEAAQPSAARGFARSSDIHLRSNAHFVDVQPANVVDGVVLSGACRWYEFKVDSIDDGNGNANAPDDAPENPADARPTRIEATVVHAGRLRDCLGFNRAKHAVLEAAILATRIHLTGAQHVVEELDRLSVIVDKTGGADEHLAMQELRAFVEAALRGE